MDNIINKALRDVESGKNRPVIFDILSPKGFLRYFFYRNTMPFARDASYIIIDTIQIIVIAKMLGYSAATGGVIGYAFILFLTDIWSSLSYSIREKIIESEMLKNEKQEITKYFSALTFLGTAIWVVLCVLAFSFVKVGSSDGEVLFVAHLTAMIFTLISSSYFLSTYTLSRIYIPMQYTIASRVFCLLLGVALLKVFGVYGFAISIFVNRILDLFITKHYCDRVLRVQKVRLVPKEIDLSQIYRQIFLLLSPINKVVKRFSSFLLLNLDKLLLIILVHHYYKSYVVDFFLLYQIINFFLLVPTRISKSMYYDTVLLLRTKNFSLLRLLVNYNLIIATLPGVVFAFAFSLLPSMHLPYSNWLSMITDLAILDQWKWLYILIFSSFMIKVVNRLLLVSEAHVTLCSTYLLFEYLLVLVLLFHNQYFLQSKEILVFFSIKGQLSLFYAALLLLIYFSGIWKKDSLVLGIKGKDDHVILKSYEEFRSDYRNAGQDAVVLFINLEKRYSRDAVIGDILDTAKSNFNAFSGIRISKNTLILICRKTGADLEDLRKSSIVSFSAFSNKIITCLKQDLFTKITMEQKPDSIYPSLFVKSTNYNLNNIELNDPSYSIHSVKKDLSSRYIGKISQDPDKNDLIFRFLRKFEVNKYIGIDAEMLKLCQIGMLPLISGDKVIHFIETHNVDLEYNKMLAQAILLSNLTNLITNN